MRRSLREPMNFESTSRQLRVKESLKLFGLQWPSPIERHICDTQNRRTRSGATLRRGENREQGRTLACSRWPRASTGISAHSLRGP